MTQSPTYETAHSAAWDEGNRHMKQAGRKIWNEDDYNHAVAVFNRLYPLETEMREKGITVTQ